ncbi:MULTISPECIES: type II toxin-antitoxin system VapC family toxin [unclassified Sphingomonas]|uniref:type II toxin-antitoxin system VapC family toxin n=1 Tax=unclassified Sphingomonas TaxID=196159 RepID=UPI0025E9ADA3|nr:MULTISPECIES: type II toxin-antitoxin system VapC family toxin [unclassified Sphingomonas]
MTIFIDASAMVAMIAKEPEATHFADRISWEEHKLTSPIAVWESVRAVARVRGIALDEARTLVADFLHDAAIRLVAIDAGDGDIALDAHQRYGKGVHEAALNMGDCFAYASTKRHEAVILFKGRDFIHTDLEDVTLA